jgi:hypothetical protein
VSIMSFLAISSKPMCVRSNSMALFGLSAGT